MVSNCAPYSVLPELAIFNLLLARYRNKNILIWSLYSILFIFTCTYHAYGILISLLPFMYWQFKDRQLDWKMVFVVLTGGCIWTYYASYNSFGWTPNGVQTQSNAFQYMPKSGFFNNVFKQLTGGGLIMYALCPVLLFRLFNLSREDWLYLTLLILVPLSLIFLVSLKTNAWILPRYFIWVIPWFAIFCVTQLDYVKRFNK